MKLGHQIGSNKAQMNQQRQSEKLKILADMAKTQVQKAKKEIE